MKLKTTLKAFTLIELLVVITIIGILATGATAVYTSQIQKARDATRINSLKAMQSAIEQVYQDEWEYPYATTFVTQVSLYIETLPADPKHNQPCNDGGSGTSPECAFAYITSADSNGILYWEYEISTSFENAGNVSAKAETDSWSDDVRLELGLNNPWNDTVVDDGDITTANSWVCGLGGAVAWAATDLVIINWNPATAGNECG